MTPSPCLISLRATASTTPIRVNFGSDRSSVGLPARATAGGRFTFRQMPPRFQRAREGPAVSFVQLGSGVDVHQGWTCGARLGVLAGIAVGWRRKTLARLQRAPPDRGTTVLPSVSQMSPVLVAVQLPFLRKSKSLQMLDLLRA